MIKRFFLKYLDVEYKWVDGTKTTVELCCEISGFGEFVMCYAHTDEDIKTAMKNEDKYMDILMNVIKENALENNRISRMGIN